MNKLLSIILFFACSYDGAGVTDSPKTNSTYSSSTTLILTTEIELTTTTGNQTTSIESSSSLNPTTGNITGTTEISTNTTEIITTTSTNSSSTTLELTTTDSIQKCGDCIMQENEECDWCIYEYIPGLSSCKQRDGRIIKQCWIELGPTTLWVGKPLEGMTTPEYDQEEANLLCQIKTRMQNVEAESYEINQGTNPSYNIILPENVNGLGYLLKTINDIYSNQELYYFNNKDIPIGFEMEAFLYADSCVTI